MRRGLLGTAGLALAAGLIVTVSSCDGEAVAPPQGAAESEDSEGKRAEEASPRLAAKQWQNWAGPNGDRRVKSSKPVTREFPEWGPRRRWVVEVGGGYSGLLVRDGTVYTAYRDDSSEVVTALASDSGEALWEQRYEPTPYENMENAFGDGPSSTPLLLGERLFMVSIDGVLRSFKIDDGELQWKVDLHERYGRQNRKEEYGYTAPPMTYDGQLLVAVGGSKHGVVALNPLTGQHLWGSPPARFSYASPVLIDVDGQDQYVFFSPTEVIGMDPRNGAFLWKHPVECWTENNLTPALYLGDRYLWVAGQLDAGTRVLRLPVPGSDDAPEVIWESEDLRQAHWGSFVEGEYVYGSIGGNFSSALAAVHWPTGEVAWRYRGYHLVKGVMIDDLLYFLDENGQIAIASLSPQGVEIHASNQLLDRVSWTAPTVVDDVLYVRNQTQIVAVELSPSMYERGD